jgi:ribonuclease Z
MVEFVTAEDDKVAPVRNLEEICKLMRVTDTSIIKEITDFVLTRFKGGSSSGQPLLRLPLSFFVLD